MKNKRIFIITLLVLFTLVSSFFIFLKINMNKEAIKNRINDISSHYNNFVKTNKETKLYYFDKNIYKQYGKINKDIYLILDDIDITENTEYFYVPSLNLYIKYDDVTKTNEIIKEKRFENYIPFNINIKTKKITSFYNSDGILVYTINKSFDFEVIIKKTDSYGIIYNDELLYIKKDDVSSLYKNENTKLNSKKYIRTLTYHFLYDPKTTECNQEICYTLDQFENNLKYIRENNYFTLKMDELDMFLSGEINIPDNSIVLTIDDGTVFDLKVLDLLEKYKTNLTMFVITSINEKYDYLESNYLTLASHTENLHKQYICPDGNQGGGILCLDYDVIMEDLNKSSEKLGGSKYFAYPFYDYNSYSISILKDAGFKLAFIGQHTTYGISYPNVTNKYMIPRTAIFNSTSQNEFISLLKKIEY